MANTMDDLREHLFDTLKQLKDKDKPLDIDRAKAVCEVAGKIIETAKVEVAHLNVVGGTGSGFIPDRALPAPGNSAKPGSPRLIGSGSKDAAR